MPSPNKRILIAAAALILLLGGTFWLVRTDRTPSTDSGEGSSGARPVASPGVELGAGAAAGAPSKSPALRPADQSALGKLEQHFAKLSAARTAEEARALLEELRLYLRALDPEVAAAIITQFMADGRNADLPLPFAIGEGGFLTTPPTFRVALLDILGWLNPQAALTLGKEILATPTAADEWAIALRNVARLDTGDDAQSYLREKTEELINHPDWQAQPSVGYLNAFDVLVHIEAAESTPLLSTLVQRKDRKDLAHAGFLTLDRLTQRAPDQVLARLAADRALHESRPQMVAQQFARADLREPAQREILTTWLLDPIRTPLELETFSGTYPNHNQMISMNLLTSEAHLNGAELRAHDTAALTQINAWLADPAFSPVHPHLTKSAQRLQRFVQPPAPGP